MSAAKAPTAFDSLPHDVLQLIVELGFPIDGFFDRGDALEQAAVLACVGSAGCTELARMLFARLSPRLGEAVSATRAAQLARPCRLLPVACRLRGHHAACAPPCAGAELPGGVSEASPVKELKAACKAWHLPTGGSKAELWERLQDQVRDSEVDADGDPPAHCVVSGATREELTGHRHRTISQTKARDVYNLSKGDLAGLAFSVDSGKGGIPAKLFQLNDVKALSARRHKSWEGLQRTKADHRRMLEDFSEKYKQEKADRDAALRAELARRGRAADDALHQNPGLSAVTWGSKRGDGPAAAVDHLERMWWCVSQPQRRVFFNISFNEDRAPPSKKMSQYKIREERLERAACATLRWEAFHAASLQALRDQAPPPSVLPELERRWAQTHPQAAPPGVAGPSGGGEAAAAAADDLRFMEHVGMLMGFGELD